ncbi:hypothetical protein DK842_17730 [Chromobacterium phragmitis]|nr:hypothetical protein DK842_17730 [Chromobacterium phragmitis]
MTPDQLAALRAAAEAATPGPWRTGGSKPDGLHEITVYGSQVVIDTDIGPKVLLEGNSNFQAESVANAAYIAAANPAAVLALLGHIDAQAARIAELERVAARYRWLTQDAYIGECFTDRGVVLEICGTDREIPVFHERATDREEVDAAIDAAMERYQPPSCG